MITSRTAYFSLIPRCSSTRCSRKFFRDYFARGGAKERRSSVVGGLPSTSNRVQTENFDSPAFRNQLFLSSLHTPKDGHFSEDVTKPLGPDGFQELLPHVDTFIFDADGVLWLGDEVIPGSPTFINYLIQNNKRVIVLSNNATKSRAVYAKKLASLGFHRDLNKDYFVNPAAIVADALYRAGMTSTRRVYLIGAQGICDEMDAVGIEYFGHGPEPLEAADEAEGSAFIYNVKLEDPAHVGAVVVGYEKHFNYKKLMKAANYLKHRHCLFLATNEDETCPGPDPDVLIPDAGPIVAAVRCASGREPLTVGKPYSPAFDYIKRRWNIEPNRTMMVGDRTNTDVKFGRDHGLKTLLVLSGCHQLEDIMHNHSNKMFDMVPDYFATCLGALLSRGQV